MAPKELSAAIDEDSKAMLDSDVRKGKPRKFVLITKGAAVVALAVFKTGAYASKIANVKKAGFQGQATCGVVAGKGVNITLQLPGNRDVADAMGTDGLVCESEPCKPPVLRVFLEEHTQAKFRPEFQLVTEVAKAARVSELDEDQEAALANEVATAVEQGDRKQKLTEALKRLALRIQQAITAHPARSGEILARGTVAKEHLQAERLDDAEHAILDYTRFLQSLDSQAPVTGAAPTPPPSPGRQREEVHRSPKASEWDWRLSDLTPKLKKVLGEKLGDFGQVAALFKQAQSALSNNVETAIELLKQCAKLVDAALTVGEEAWTDATDDDYRDAWLDLEGDFAQQRKQIELSLVGEALDEFDGLTRQARAAAEQGQFKAAVELALQAADVAADAERRAREMEAERLIPKGVVAETVALLERARERWEAGVQNALTDLQKLQSDLRTTDAELADALTDVLTGYQQELSGLLVLGRSATNEGSAASLRATALEKAAELHREVDGDRVIGLLDSYQDVPLRLRDGLLKALADVQQYLTTA